MNIGNAQTALSEDGFACVVAFSELVVPELNSGEKAEEPSG